MHLAYPPRKASNPPIFKARTSGIPWLSRRRNQTIALVLLVLFGSYWLIFTPGILASSRHKEHVPSGKPSVVIVTATDSAKYGQAYLNMVKENRELYAKRHGYQVFLPRALDYDQGKFPASWAQISAARHALSEFPECKYIWLLDQHSYIMNPDQSLEHQVLATKNIESLMIRDKSVVPPESVIRTFAHLQAHDVNLIISQDKAGLNTGSIIIRNGEWAKFLLETWMDPLYKSYNFQKAERHGLEHMVQWHPTVLAKVAVVPQTVLASYTNEVVTADQGKTYVAGDFVVLFNGCSNDEQNSCEKQSSKYAPSWREAFGVAGDTGSEDVKL